jgi:myo-inositol-1(or 4)-monophosphatase
MNEILVRSNYFSELKSCFNAAKKAGKIIDNYSKNDFDVKKKKDGSKVTEADKKSQEKIVEIISEEFPEDGFLGEEEDLTPSNQERIWVVDPLDGTFNFAKDFSHYCTSIALKKDGEIKLGMVFSPCSANEPTYLAVKNCGAFKTPSNKLENTTQVSVSSQSQINDSLFFLSSFDTYEGQLDAELSVFRDLAKEGAVHRQLGSCALEMCRVAAGEADFQVTPVVKEWDYAAGKLIVEEAGGEVRIRDSRFPGCTEVISSNGFLQDEVEEIVSDGFQ